MRKKKDIPPVEAPFDMRKWLTENPKAEEVKGDAGSQYIPIGIIENLLDKFNVWDTQNFKFAIIRTDKFWFADASVVLEVQFFGDGLESGFYKKVVGAVTYQISSKDENQDHAATALSLATSNAAKKLGIRLGRALNNRLTIGDILPVIKVEKVDKNVEKERIILLVHDSETVEELKSYVLKAKQYSIMKEYNKKLKQLSKNTENGVKYD